MAEKRTVTIELLDIVQAGFNDHDVEAILSHFADDCEWLMARGPDPWDARRLTGKQAIGDVLRAHERPARRGDVSCENAS